MNFATMTNIVTILFCLAVLVQSVRMMRSLQSVKEGALTDVVEALDRSTSEAREVLGDLKLTLGECAANGRVVADGRDMAEELGVMIGIANATAERVVEAASAANRPASGTQDADLPREMASA